MEERSVDSAITLRWLIQAGLGIVLIALLAFHLIVNHCAAPQGLLTYADIIRYYDVPGIAWMETFFLIAITVHCLLGMHSILLDLNLQPNLTRLFTLLLTFAGAITILYGIWLIRTVALLSTS